MCKVRMHSVRPLPYLVRVEPQVGIEYISGGLGLAIQVEVNFSRWGLNIYVPNDVLQVTFRYFAFSLCLLPIYPSLSQQISYLFLLQFLGASYLFLRHFPGGPTIYFSFLPWRVPYLYLLHFLGGSPTSFSFTFGSITYLSFSFLVDIPPISLSPS